MFITTAHSRHLGQHSFWSCLSSDSIFPCSFFKTFGSTCYSCMLNLNPKFHIYLNKMPVHRGRLSWHWLCSNRPEWRVKSIKAVSSILCANRITTFSLWPNTVKHTEYNQEPSETGSAFWLELCFPLGKYKHTALEQKNIFTFLQELARISLVVVIKR